jgi:hypothetical protein
MGMTEGTLAAGEGASLELADIQSGALHGDLALWPGRYLLPASTSERRDGNWCGICAIV